MRGVVPEQQGRIKVYEKPAMVRLNALMEGFIPTCCYGLCQFGRDEGIVDVSRPSGVSISLWAVRTVLEQNMN
jgi:hypothetical protein